MISKAAIVEAALAEIDQFGLQNFSVRAVARRLGVHLRAVQWHVGTKESLLAEVVASVMAGVKLPSKNGDWRHDLIVVAKSIRRTLSPHPEIAALIAHSMSSYGGAYMPLADTVLQSLHDAGFRGRHLRNAYNAIVGATLGFIIVELAGNTDREHASTDEWSWPEDTASDLINENRRLLEQKAFSFRGPGPHSRAFDQSFVTLLEIVIGGLETLRSDAADDRRSL